MCAEFWSRESPALTGPQALLSFSILHPWTASDLGHLYFWIMFDTLLNVLYYVLTLGSNI